MLPLTRIACTQREPGAAAPHAAPRLRTAMRGFPPQGRRWRDVVPKGIIFSFVCGVLAVLQPPGNLPRTDATRASFLSWSQHGWGSAPRVIQGNAQPGRLLPKGVI